MRRLQESTGCFVSLLVINVSRPRLFMPAFGRFAKYVRETGTATIAAKQNYRNLPFNGKFPRDRPFPRRGNSIGFFEMAEY